MSKLHGLYKGVVVFDSDVADTTNTSGAAGRVKVKVEGVSYSSNKSESIFSNKISNAAFRCETYFRTPN